MTSPAGLHLRLEAVVHAAQSPREAQPANEVGSADAVIRLGTVNVAPTDMIRGSVTFQYDVAPYAPNATSNAALLHEQAQRELSALTAELESTWINRFGTGSQSPSKTKWSWEKTPPSQGPYPNSVNQYYHIYEGDIYSSEAKEAWATLNQILAKWSGVTKTSKGTITRKIEIYELIPNRNNVISTPVLRSLNFGVVQGVGILKNGWVEWAKVDYLPAYSGVNGSHAGTISAIVSRNSRSMDSAGRPPQGNYATTARLRLYTVNPASPALPVFWGEYPMDKMLTNSDTFDVFNFKVTDKIGARTDRDYMAEVIVVRSPATGRLPSAPATYPVIAASDIMKLRFGSVNLAPMSKVDGFIKLSITATPKSGNLTATQKAALERAANARMTSSVRQVRAFISKYSTTTSPSAPTKPTWIRTEVSSGTLFRNFVQSNAQIYTSEKASFGRDLSALLKVMNTSIVIPEGRIRVSVSASMPAVDL